ncbi:hypothetical protein [Agromyces sp. Soil535]|uniref:hypothetical protein n=1 Tax=Agromyces sp. Soil535 TaxID=1736390 RepID=UPI0006F49394|nr:hypothetical protein [Agromyces sp. Soil535]KRE22326.1 hypothetical protein ASG80_10305 [Agromyces sp. Soil535]
MTQKTTPRRTRLVLTGAATALALAGGTLVMGAAPAYATPSIVATDATDATEPPSDPDAGRLRDWRWSQLPEELRADLVELAQADEAERPALRAEIRAKALAGDYGDRARRIAERIAALVAALPDDLRADLVATQELAGAERRDAIETIVDGMLAGDYGDEVQERAERVSERVSSRLERRALVLIIGGVAAGIS